MCSQRDKGEPERHAGRGNGEVALRGSLCKMKIVGSRDFFFFTFPLLKQILLKRTPALSVRGKVPWNVGPSVWNV